MAQLLDLHQAYLARVAQELNSAFSTPRRSLTTFIATIERLARGHVPALAAIRRRRARGQRRQTIQLLQPVELPTEEEVPTGEEDDAEEAGSESGDGNRISDGNGTNINAMSNGGYVDDAEGNTSGNTADAGIEQSAIV
ncbi:hypothetical protein PC114_g7640 [Phytophthora cactorum]|nr:hypothetical protein PC114_g7640 [Phytophthora cactorum]KAG3028950.1 hypothetical protein PC120_g4565 [Phytophthora cactorum]KAG3185833.1 hypothetical protein C6341_g4217 [Phytophthora cactorum]KAG3196886.1 hypothetical protein PC128_g7278 [Phytophthora cactorum]